VIVRTLELRAIARIEMFAVRAYVYVLLERCLEEWGCDSQECRDIHELLVVLWSPSSLTVATLLDKRSRAS
jgi:hypothetical protein